MKVIGRYALFDELARGGMATVHIGRLLGPGGFTRTVAIKRLHPHLGKDPEFVTMLLDEARLAGRIQHANVVAMLDVVATEGELFLVMEYVHGETLLRLLRASKKAGAPVRPEIASAVIVGVLEGLHAAHEVRGDRGEPLGLVHRDVTPHNIMLRQNGNAVVVDFGVAKAAGRFHTTEEGKIKGKLPYMAPEQLRGGSITRRVDVYAVGAVLWEILVGERMVGGTTEGEVLEKLLFGKIAPPSSRVPSLPPALDAVVMRALAKEPADRFATAHDMARALEAAVAPALTSQVANWVAELVPEVLLEQEARLASIETLVADTLDSGSSAPLAILTERVDARDSGPKVPVATPPAADPVEATGAATTLAQAQVVAPAPARPSFGRVPWIAVALLAAAIPIVWYAAKRSSAPTEPSAPAAAQSAAATSAESATQASAPETVTPPDAPPATPPPASAAPSATQVLEVPSTASLPPRAAAVRPTATTTTTATATAKKPCVPFRIDPATGRKIYNVDCIQ